MLVLLLFQLAFKKHKFYSNTQRSDIKVIKIWHDNLNNLATTPTTHCSSVALVTLALRYVMFPKMAPWLSMEGIMIMTVHHHIKCFSFRESSYCFVTVLTVSVPANESLKKSLSEYYLWGCFIMYELIKGPYFQIKILIIFPGTSPFCSFYALYSCIAENVHVENALG